MSATRLRADCELSATALSAVLNLLEETGAVRTGRDGSRFTGTADTDDASADDVVDAVVRSALALHANHRKLEQSRIDMMRGYCETTGCRRQFLLGYFGDSAPVPCGACGNCTDLVTVPASGLRRKRSGDAGRPDKAAARGRWWTRAGARADASAGAVRAAETVARPTADNDTYLPGVRVSHDQWGQGEVMSEGDGKITILFESVGYRTLSLAVVTDRRLLVALPETPR